MSLEGFGLLLVLIGLIALPYAILYGYARNTHEEQHLPRIIPYAPFSMFSRLPMWRRCPLCHHYAYTPTRRCTAHRVPVPMVPLSYYARYRVARMRDVCVFVGDIEVGEQEAFERFALTLTHACPGHYWSPSEVAGLYHLDACVSSDIEDGGSHAVL